MCAAVAAMSNSIRHTNMRVRMYHIRQVQSVASGVGADGRGVG